MAKNGITLGFIGQGKVSTRNLTALLGDFVEANEGCEFVVPITKELWNDELRKVADFALEEDFPLAVVTDDSAAKVRGAKDYISAANKEHKVAKVTSKLLSLLEKAPDARLVVLWDDEDEVVGDFALEASKADVVCLDLTNGLDEIELGEEPAQAAEEETEEQEQAASDDEEVQPYTRKELEGFDLKVLKEICEANEITVPPRTRTKTIIQMILDAQQGETVVPEEADDSGGEDEQEEEVPEELEDEDAVEGRIPSGDDDDAQTFTAAAAVPSLVGSCLGCGGPVFAVGLDPVVTWFHSRGCSIEDQPVIRQRYNGQAKQKTKAKR